jgi:SOS-response transcriptional repressor LexA
MLSLTPHQQVIRLNQLQEYYILRVCGTSMNDARPEKIEDGDYVLMRKQNGAENQDIVAAEITSGDGKDDRATLKRFKRVNGKILLLPESTDPEFAKPMYVDRMFTTFDVDFCIRGVALAVFKKL